MGTAPLTCLNDIDSLHGIGEEAGQALVEHPGVDLVSFASSSETGAHVAAICASIHRRVCLEIGGNNAQVVIKDVDIGPDPNTQIGPIINPSQLQRISNDVETPYGLSASVYTRDINRAFQAIRDSEASIPYTNGPTIGAEVHLPFGGVQQTGNGRREAGTAALDVLTEWKTVYIDDSGRLPRAQIDKH